VQGASALGALLASHSEADVRVLVIWLPVMASDTGPPTNEVRRPLQDTRVMEFWDPELWASPRMMPRAVAMARAQGEEPDFDPNGIAWDLIALFPRGTTWEDPFPAPVWWGAPVVDSLEPVEGTLSGLRPRPEGS
jgi:hypothetical protein